MQTLREDTMQTIRRSKRDPLSLINHKDDEKLLSESLYRNLHVIQRFHTASYDFLTIYEQHMFIKSNPKAFLHVFHLIFTCLDAAGFNKRFLWPIYDKAGESLFRSSTLDYINHLNAIHQLGFETLKLHNIHIPGGLKFIKIVHKLSVLAMQVTLNRNKRSVPNVNDIPDSNKQLTKLEAAIDDGLDFVARLQVQSNLVRERTDAMKRMMVSFFEGSTINVTNEQCWSCLSEQWRNQLDHAVENDVKPKLERVAMVSKNVADIEQLLTKLFVDRKENFIEYDKGKLIIAQNVLMKWDPDLEPVAGMIQNNFINFENLLRVFQFVLPRIMEKIEKFEFRGMKALEYESDQIDILDARISRIQDQFSNFGKEIQPFLKKEEKRFRKFCLNVPDLPFNIMTTPIVTRKTNTMRRCFALMDESLPHINLFNESLPCSSRTINKHQNVNTTIASGSTECSSSMQSNKARNDAKQILLRNKNSKGNVSQSFSNISCLSRFSSPKFSSTMCSTAVHHENKYDGDELKISPVYPNAQPTRTIPKNVVENSTFLSPNSTVQRKFSTNSAHHLNHTDLRGSPTRRWEVTDNTANVHQNLMAPVSMNGNRHHEQVEGQIKNIVATFTDLCIKDDELLGNISDSILNNVTN